MKAYTVPGALAIVLQLSEKLKTPWPRAAKSGNPRLATQRCSMPEDVLRKILLHIYEILNESIRGTAFVIHIIRTDEQDCCGARPSGGTQVNSLYSYAASIFLRYMILS
jgi:hypothetical protein